LLTYTLLPESLIPKPAVGVNNNIEEARNFELVVALTALFFNYGTASLKIIKILRHFLNNNKLVIRE